MPAPEQPTKTLIQRFGAEGLRTTVTDTMVGHWATQLAEKAEARGADAQTDSAALPVEGAIVGGQYRLGRLLGEGMFGRVHVAERTDVCEHRVALKLINSAVYGGRNVERELVMLAAATHPNIVQLKDHGVTDDYVWLTMPLYQGETLAERLERGPLSLREAYEIFLPIARGVESLHERGLRHQDIKPENIFLAEFGERVHPVLLDLGVAAESNASFVAATTLYGAPEQVAALGGVSGHAPLSEKMDVYCLAATLLRSLVGKAYFPGENATSPFDITNAFEERESQPLNAEAMPDLTGTPRRLLTSALSRWLCRDPSERPDARHMAQRLDVLLEQEAEEERAVQHAIEAQRRSYRRIRLAMASLLLLGVGASLYLYNKRETLRLASELELARVAGAQSFDALDTCVAAHGLSQREVHACADDRTREAEVFAASVAQVKKKSQTSLNALTRRLALSINDLQSCDEKAASASDGWRKDRHELASSHRVEGAQWQQERTALASERDALSAAKARCDQSLTSISDLQSACRHELASCMSERNQSTATPPRSIPEPAGPSRSSGPTGSTGSNGTADEKELNGATTMANGRTASASRP